MTDIKLNNIDPDDITELLPIIEQSFGFKFEQTDLENATTFGKLCDVVESKLHNIENSDDCTTQQAFYKLRDCISTILHIDKSTISTNTQLLSLFPSQSRRQTIKQIEDRLGFKLKILRPKYFITSSLAVILIASLIGLFFNWKLALGGLLFFAVGLRIANYFANTLDLQTVGEVAEKMSTENYLKSRRNSSTINKKEIENKVRDLFCARLDLPRTAVTRDAAF